MTIDELRALQDRENLRGIHLVEIREDGFTLAHTDFERATVARGGPALEQCAIHRWLTDRGRGEEEPGLYVFKKREADGYSESFRGDAQPWSLIRAEHLEAKL